MSKFLWKEFLVIFAANYYFVSYMNTLMGNELGKTVVLVLWLITSGVSYYLYASFYKHEG